MPVQRHVIKRQVIELTVQREEDARVFQDALSRIYRQRIIPWMERHFDELSAPDRLTRIATLDLDIGTLEPETLEEDFVSRVEAILTAELAARIEKEETAVEKDGSPSSLQSQLELFALFVHSGSLPWWADASRPGILAENLELLLGKSPKALGKLLAELTAEPDQRLRLIHHYTDDQLGALCALLLPAYAAEMQPDLSEQLGLLHSPGTSGGGQARLRTALWSSILWIAGMGGRHYASLADFYKAVFRRLDPEQDRMLLDELRQAVLARKAGAEAGGMLTGAPRPAEPADRVGAEPAERLQDGQANKVGVEPGGKFLPELLRAVQSHGAAAASQRPGRDQRPDKNSPDQPAPARGASPPAQAASPPAADPKALDLSFSETDEILVGNSGLVILWPFLGHFFTRLGLMDEERRFTDPAARQRAAGLLQVLAQALDAQEAFPPEYLLPLNKILCGLALTGVFDFGPPLLKSEGQECADLLEAVIAQVPILNNMSADGFRGSFLLRPGILSIRDGMWLLRVERQTYDIVLDRFPWGWEWVKLSWMEALLRVEW